MPEATANPVKNEAARTRNIVLASSPVMLRTLSPLSLPLPLRLRLRLSSDPRSSILMDVSSSSSSSNTYHLVMWMNDSSRMVTDHHTSRSTAQPSWHLIWVTSSLVDEGPLCVVQVLGQGGARARAHVQWCGSRHAES